MDNFLENDSWFDQEFREKSSGRYATFRVALNLLYQNTSNPYIVETGTVRMVEDYGAGYSTVIFGTFLNRLGKGKLTTIDLSPENMEVCQMITSGLSDRIEYVVENSLTALEKIDKPIDLLYLDSMDAPLDPGVDATPCQEHNLAEFKKAEHLLHGKSIVLIDDNSLFNGGKAKLTKLYLKEKGWRLLLNGQQSLWIR